MNATVSAALAANLADVVRIRDTPVEPFGYGTDISCADDIDPRGRDVSGFTVEALGQAIYRRLITPRGSNPDDADYGFDVVGYLNRGTTAQELRTLAGKVRSEVTKDDRVASAKVSMVPTPTGDAVTLKISIQPYADTLGGFSLTLAVASGAAILEEINAL